MKNFEKELDEFINIAGVDIVSLHNIFGIIAGGFKNQIPDKTQLRSMLHFIIFLFKKYDKNLACLEGPNMIPIKKTPDELISWLNKEYDKGNYFENLDYGIWFDLDKSVIPKKYLPKIDK